jgi:response regulator RpfG family c-di-GMP phosphodiesterase
MKNANETGSSVQEKSLELIYALNNIATELQNSIQSEENVYAVFQKQVIALGLRGGFSLLDEQGKNLNFKTVAFANPLKKILNRYETKHNIPAEEYSIPIESVDIYQKVTREGQSIFVADTSTVAAQIVATKIKAFVKPLLSILGIPPGIFAPLIYDGKIKGMLNIVGPTLTENDVPAMRAFANQIAVALENARLVRNLQSANEQLENAYQKTLEGWVQALDLRDNETMGHTLRVAEETVRFANFLGVSAEDIPHIRRGALLHDIGKLALPDSILRKSAPLSEAEWLVMRQHPLTAYRWLSAIDYLKPAIDIPYCHHEHWDGNGYVQGLGKEDIPYWARIFAVVDVWDAMRSDRPYRKAIPEIETLQYIKEQSGKLFDPTIVEAFLDLRAQGAQREQG